MRAKAIVWIALVMGCLTQGGTAAAASITQLNSGDFLFPGQRLVASQCYYRLDMQHDGNLVTYDIHGRARWASGTTGSAFAVGGYANMQPDGNFVIYNWDDAAVWATNTVGWSNSRLVQQLDGNLVVYSSPLNWALWASGVVAERGFSSPCGMQGVKTHVSDNIDRPGGDFQSFSVPRASWCGYYCAQNSSCRSYTYFNGTCFLKNTTPGLRVLSGAVSGVIVQ